MMSSIGKLMSDKVDALRLTFYTAPLTCIVLLPFYLSLEDKKYRDYQAVSSSGYIGEAAWRLEAGHPHRRTNE